MPNKKAPVFALDYFNSPEALGRFRKAAAAFTARTTKTPEMARQVLTDEGIYTKSGKLTKNYR